MPRYEFVEGTSSKFWEIELEDTLVRTHWGRIGTKGQEKEEEFDSKAEARKAYEKAIRAKTSKGYKRVSGEEPAGAAGGASNPDLEAAILKDLDGVEPYLAYGRWLREQGDLRGELIELQARALRDPKDRKASVQAEDFRKAHLEELLGDAAEHADLLDLTWHLGFIKSASIHPTYDDDVSMAEELLPGLLDDPSARFLRELTLGCATFDGENDYTEVIEAIAEHAPKTLSTLFIGDFTSDESELSWSSLGDAQPLWDALPGLRDVTLRAGSMSLGKIELPECRAFAVETGGLSRASMKSIANARWPKLETLEIWFGDENYGAECAVKDVQPVLDAQGLPNLTRLGLMNSEFVNELLDVLPKSKVLKQLKELSLAMGVMTDEGAEKLLASKDAYAHLERLDVSQNLLSDEMVARLKKELKPTLLAHEQREDDPEYRYVAVGE